MQHKSLILWKWLLTGALACGSLAKVSAGTLTGSFAPITAGSNVNLTLAGKLDWVHWGLYTETSVTRKNCASVQIGDLTLILDTNNPNGFIQAYQYTDNANGYTWSDGNPTINVTNTPTGIWTYGIPNLGTGFEFSVPADPTLRTLQIFVGVFSGRGNLQVSLSDGSAPAYTDSSLANLFGNGPGGVYTLNYSANSPGQSLRIRWTLAQAAGANAPSANVTLQAAALTAPEANNPPFAILTNPTANSSFPAPASLTIDATAQDFDGTITNVTFYSGVTQLGQKATPPYSFTWNNVPRGHYMLTAIATDNAGAMSCGLPVEIFVYGTGGGQTNTIDASPAAVDLTAEGTADWTHWGLFTNTSFNYKELVTRKISNFTPIGSAPVKRYADNYTGFTWSDGTPTSAINNATSGTFITGVGNGFQLTAPADTTPRQLRVYVGGYGFQGEFQAWLSDLSAPPYVDTSVSNIFGNSDIVYTITYTSASAGQQMMVTYRSLNLFDQAYGNVTLQAATLQGGPSELLPVHLFNPARIGNDFVLSFNTVTNRSYTVQYSDLLPAPAWTNLTVVAGNGASVTVTNLNVPSGQRFYRVQTE
jgi:hypothetical protein